MKNIPKLTVKGFWKAWDCYKNVKWYIICAPSQFCSVSFAAKFRQPIDYSSFLEYMYVTSYWQTEYYITQRITWTVGYYSLGIVLHQKSPKGQDFSWL